MGRWTITALVVNAILGSGVFGLPSVIAGKLGALAPAAWILGGLGNGVVILCFAEVASRFRDAGGAYLYARAALPRLLAIQVAWFAWLTRLTAAAAGANLFANYFAEFVPGGDGATARVGLLTLLVGGLALVNYRGVRQGATASNVFTAAKLLPLGFFVIAGAALLLLRGAPATPPRLDPSGGDWLGALLLITFAYGGYDGAMMAMGEAKEPRRDAPFALIAATVFLAILYTAVQWIVGSTLPDPGASQRPLASAAAALVGPAGATLMAAGALLSVVGFLGANFLNAPRLTFALATHADFPAFFGRIHPRFRTPHLSILAFGFLVWALALYGNFQWNATLSAVARLFVYASVCAALVVLRRRDPGGAVVRIPGGPLLAALGLALCALLAARMGRSELYVVVPVAAIALANWLGVRAQRRPVPEST